MKNTFDYKTLERWIQDALEEENVTGLTNRVLAEDIVNMVRELMEEA